MSKTGKGLVLRIVAIFLVIIGLIIFLSIIFYLHQENKGLRKELSRCQWDKKDALMVQRRLTRNLSLECPQPKCPEPDVRCPKPKCPECPEQGLLKNIISSQARQHIYRLDEYDCDQYSEELVRRLKNTGFNAETEGVVVDCSSALFENKSCKKYDGGHTIVEVDDLYIEATGGRVIHPQNYRVYGLGQEVDGLR